MLYLRLCYATVMGALMTVATRFGPSLTIFAFVYLSRFSFGQHYDQAKSFDQWVLYLLPAASILIGLFAYFVRVILKKYSTYLDHQILPFVDHLILRHVEKGNMSVVSLRNQSVQALRIVQTVLLLLLISAVIYIVSPVLSLLCLLLIAIVAGLALWRVRKGVTAKTFNDINQSMEGTIEQVMITLMIIGCMFFVPRENWLQVAIGLFVLVRFTISYRTLAKSILAWSVARQMEPLRALPIPPKVPPKKKKKKKPALPVLAPPSAATAPTPD